MGGIVWVGCGGGKGIPAERIAWTKAPEAGVC